MNEKNFKPLEGYSNYIVCDDGTIFSNNLKRNIGVVAGKDGYHRVILYNDGKRKSAKVHRVIAECFVLNTNPEINIFVNHIDGNKSNNCAVNLEWCSPSENSLHAHRVLGSYKSANKVVKVNDEVIINILDLYKSGETIENIFNLYPDIAKNTIRLYLRNKCRADLKTVEEREEISSMYLKQVPYKPRKFGVVEVNKIIPDKQLNGERFSPIEEFDNFAITSGGRVYSFKRKIFRKLVESPDGYELVTLEQNNVKKTLRVHRLVALTFLEKPTDVEKNLVNHIDLNKKNNKVENLEWVTPLENNIHYLENKGNQQGSI